jgi:hypothetical protein
VAAGARQQKPPRPRRAPSHRIQPCTSAERHAARRELPGRPGLVLLHWAAIQIQGGLSCLSPLAIRTGQQVRPSIILCLSVSSVCHTIHTVPKPYWVELDSLLELGSVSKFSEHEIRLSLTCPARYIHTWPVSR